MDAAAENGRNPVSKHLIQPDYGDEQADAGRGLPKPSRESNPLKGSSHYFEAEVLRRERGQGISHFPCSADHEQDWQPYRLIHTLAIRDDRTYIPFRLKSIFNIFCGI